MIKDVQRKSPSLRDVLAGVGLAAMSIPQVLGYAKIAGMPIVTGLYTLLLPLIAFATFGSSSYLVVAADSATAAILADGLAPMAPAASPHYIALAATVALLVAAFLLLARLLKLGFLADFLSQTVLIGFLAGVGVQLAIDMLGTMLGIETTASETASQVKQIFDNLPHAYAPTMTLTAIALTTIFALNKWAPRVPGSLIVILSSVVASMVCKFNSLGIAILGPVVAGLPHLGIPNFEWREIQSLVPLAISCGVMILAQSAATARFYAHRHHQELDEDQDLIGLAAANLSAAFSGSFVVNGSPTQTAMVEISGARSQRAQLATAFTVALVLLFLTRFLQFLPRNVLGSVIFALGIRLIDFSALRKMRHESIGEFILALTTVVVVILFGVEKGILLAIALSILRIVWHCYHPHTGVLTKEQNGVSEWKPATAKNIPEAGLVVYRFGAALFFANVGCFTKEILALVGPAPSKVQWLVVDAEAISQIDYSAAQAILDMQSELHRRGVELTFARVPKYLKSDMDRHHVTEALGPKRIFAHLQDAREAFAKRGDHQR